MPQTVTHINAEHLDRIRAWYNENPDKLGAGTVGYRRILAHYYNLLIPPDASVLEVGCGCGELLKRIKARRKVGIDMSEKQVDAARYHCPGAEFHVQAGEALELAERFDYIIVSDTLNQAA